MAMKCTFSYYRFLLLNHQSCKILLFHYKFHQEKNLMIIVDVNRISNGEKNCQEINWLNHRNDNCEAGQNNKWFCFD